MKKFLSMFVILAMLFGFAGCLDNEKDEDEEKLIFDEEKSDEEEAIEEEDAEEETEDEEETEQKEKDDKADKDKNTTLNLQKLVAGDRYWEEDFGAELVTLDYEKIYLSSEDAEKYPELSESLDALNSETSEAIEKEYEECKDWAYEHYEMSPDYFNPYELKSEFAVRRADLKVLSLLLGTYSYTGGAHGNGGDFGSNFDVQTGEKLLLSDVVNDVEEVYNLVAENVDEDILFPGTDVAEVLRNCNEVNFTLENEGITIYFSPYEIAPYAAGIISVYLSETDYPGLIKEKYLGGSEGFALEINEGRNVYYDVDGDGSVDEITCYNYGDWDSNSGYVITVNGNRYEEEMFGYFADAYFAHTKEGKNYILTAYGFDGGGGEINCYEIGDSITKLETIEGEFAYYIHDTEWYRTIMTNPESFEICKEYHALGTNNVSTEHRINRNGHIEPKEKLWLMTSWHQKATLLMDLETEIYDEKKNKVNGSYTLNEGDEILVYAADDDGYSYVKTEDGTVLRVYVDSSEWPYSIDGSRVDDIFDGLMYAG